MPSGMLPVIDGPITRGMNTVDDPKTLKQGECVRLLNAFPGVPPVPRNGCTGRLLTGTQNYRYIPPGISFVYGGNIYAVVWVYDTIGAVYKPIAVNVATGAFTDLGDADFGASIVMFDFVNIHSCVYSAISIAMSAWELSANAIGHKVIESNGIIRDMCIAEAGDINTIALNASGALNANKWFEYSFQYVRRNDSAAFTSGATPSGMILPAGIGANYEPIRIDTFLPGSCIGVEDSSKRETINVVEVNHTPSALMLTNSGLGNFSAAQCIDANTATKAFDADTGVLLGSYLKIDFGSGSPVCLTRFDVFMASSGSTNEYKIQYSDDGTNWSDASAATVVSATDWNNIAILSSVTEVHRYWRLYLNNAGADGPDVMEIRCYGKGGTTITVLTANAKAIAQGATHLRVSRTLEQTTEALAQSATKFFLFDLPLGVTQKAFNDNTSNESLSGETNQLVTGYSVAPPAAFIEYVKGRLFLMDTTGRVYYSETAGGDGGTDLETAQAYPQAWSSMFKPITYYLDCDHVDGQLSSGMKRLGDDLFFFKERKLFALFGGDPQSAPLSPVSDKVGCAFPYTITKCEIKGLFGKCLLFLGNDGPMVLQEGGRIRPFSEFKIKELWPEKSLELYSELDTDYDWIVHNCTAAFYKNTWWILYQTKAGTNRIFGYYFDPDLGAGDDAPRGALEFEFAEMS
jgi:hypothetical protein